MHHSPASDRSPDRRTPSIALALTIALWANSAISQTVSVPFSAQDRPLSSLISEIVYTVDLASLPPRPELIAEAVPDDAHLSMSLKVEILGCTLFVTPGASCSPTTSFQPVGPASTSFEVYKCVVGTTEPAYVGKTCNVRVRALDFGPAGAPATVDVTIRANTEVPFATNTIALSTAIPTQTITLNPTKDTTIYSAVAQASNGQGQSLWAATGSNELRALLAFDLSAIPTGSTIQAARLELTPFVPTITGTNVDLYAVSRNASVPWLEGTADASGDEASPTASANNAATWSHRNWVSVSPLGAWSTPGGDKLSPRLAHAPVNASQTLVIQTTELTDYVRTLHESGGTAGDGLLLQSAGGPARFASDESGFAAQSPRLVVDYQPPPASSGNITASPLTFFNEVSNFRWIYDLDHDEVLMTPIQGRCVSTFGGVNVIPYAYQYLGSPSYVGHDCCIWQADSQTGTVGAGQALFFINLDPANPANQPPDGDLDGIKTFCDSCPGRPNGPLLGSCTSGSKIGKLCRSKIDCAGGACSLAQEDQNLDGTGDACVPEPELAAGLLAGIAVLGGLAKGRLAARPSARS